MAYNDNQSPLKGKTMNISIGMAIRITPENRNSLAIVNGGLVPAQDAEGCYFFFPYSYDSFCEIVEEKTFFDIFEFGNTENDKFFVDVHMR